MLVRQRALNFAPGDEHRYSNSGYFLLSLVVERASGRSLRDVAHDRIFAPLDMTHTAYLGSYNDIVPNRAIGYQPAGSGYQADMPRWLQLGDGAVFTTVEDLVRWGENFRTTKVGGAAMRDALLTRGRLANGEVLNYALGLMHGEHRGLATVFHGGSWGGYVAEFLRFPDQQYGVAVLCNRADADPPALALKVAEIHLAGEMDAVPAPALTTASVPAPPSPSAPKLRALEYYSGTYRIPHSGSLITVDARDGALRLLEPGRFDLVARSPDQFEVVGTPGSVRLIFEAGDANDARARRVRALVAGDPPRTYERLDLTPLATGGLAAFAGTYHSPELVANLVVSRMDTALFLVLPNSRPDRLRAVGENEFLGAGVNLEFRRDATGRVTGVLLNQERASGLWFDRVEAGS
jgi:CubicO group peptidase (beta-lactamase class C family)